MTRTNDSTLPGSNQITCDDHKGSELIKIHGQRDMQTDIDHDERWYVKNDCRIGILEGNYTLRGHE